MHISVIGLGKLGLCTAACFASKGHRVIGVEKNISFVEALKKKQSPIEEDGLPELLDQAWDLFEVTTDTSYAIKNSDITLIIVPTPSDPDGRFTNRFVEDVLAAAAPALKEKDAFHVVDVVSTVMPGSSDQIFIPMLEKLTGKRAGEHFGFVYNPEFIALGTVIKNFLNPDMVLIGATDPKSSEMVRGLYATTVNNRPQYSVMSLVNAEITKLSLNCYVTMKISFANELASICERVPGADIDVVTQAVGADTRVGKKYLGAGLGFAGPCFPRDNIAFQAFAEQFGGEARLGKQVIAINHHVVDRIYSVIRNNARPGSKVSILGLSYKPGTHIIDESQSIQLAQKLLEDGYRIAVHDPRAIPITKNVLHEKVEYFEDPYECIRSASCAVLMTNWPEYTQLDWEGIIARMNPDAVLVDSWRMLKDREFNHTKYIALGLGSNAI